MADSPADAWQIMPAPPRSWRFGQLDARRRFLTADDAMWEFFAPELRRRLADLDATATSSDIAYLLGYAEPTSSSRAFSAWTGRTPQPVRVGSG